MNLVAAITEFLARFPTSEAGAFIALVMSIAGFGWMFFDKFGERWSQRQQAKLQLNQDRRDEKRTAVDIATQQTETQLRLSEAQLNQASMIANQIDNYTKNMQKIGELFDEIECDVGDLYTADGHKAAVMKIRRLRREIGI